MALCIVLQTFLFTRQGCNISITVLGWQSPITCSRLISAPRIAYHALPASHVVPLRIIYFLRMQTTNHLQWAHSAIFLKGFCC